MMHVRVPLLVCLVAALALGGQDFRSSQLKNPRVRVARQEKEALLRRQFAAQGLAYPPREIVMRIFKYEETFELWVRGDTQQTFSLFKEYKVCASSGGPGPKRVEGDHQVPEGFYRVELFNPASLFYLSLRVNYPNAADRIPERPAPPRRRHLHSRRLRHPGLRSAHRRRDQRGVLAGGRSARRRAEADPHPHLPCPARRRRPAPLAPARAARPQTVVFLSTPALILHGESEVRVHFAQGMELYNALKRQGVPLKMVANPRQPHGLQESRLVLDAARRNLDWFAHYLK